jgi:transglutaminase 1
MVLIFFHSFPQGDDPIESKGTQVYFILSAKDEKDQWGAKIVKQEKNTVLISVFTPPSCIVGKWMFSVDVIKKENEKVTIFRYNHKDPIYMLFNPWCKGEC